MAYPILAAKNTWWAPTVSTVKSSSITEIELIDSYTPDSSVTVVDSWDASAAKDGSITCYVIGTKLIIAGNGSGKIAANEDSSYCFCPTDRFSAVTNFTSIGLLDINGANMTQMFARCSALTSLDLSGWTGSKVTNIYALFVHCASLSSINLPRWDTSEVEEMSLVFANCSSLKSLDLSNWNTSKVTATSCMFMGCSSLETINVSNWNLSNMTDMSFMFKTNRALVSIIGLSDWDVSNVNNMNEMFSFCEVLPTLNLSSWDVSNVVNMAGMFWNCHKLTTIGDVFNWDVSKVTTIEGLFGNCHTLKHVGDISNWDVSNMTTMWAAFAGCWALTSIGDISNWNISKVSNVGSMFNACEALSSIGDISNWDVSKVTYMSTMFQNCSKLTGIGDLSNWDTSNVTDMSFMFYGASSIKEINVSKWDVSKVTNFDHFAAHAGLRRKGVENWKTTSATNMNALFHNCAEEELDLSGWDVSKVQFFCQMFENSPNLKRIKGLEKWNTSAGLDFGEMFGRCYKLEELDLSSFDTSKAKNGVVGSANGGKSETLKNMFLSCNNLKKVKIGPNFSINGNGSNTTAANKAILPTPSTDYIEGADGMWYAFNGEPHAPNAIKDKTAETYFASYALCADQDIIVKNGSMIDAAKAIREKNGATDHYTPAQFGAAIRALN